MTMIQQTIDIPAGRHLHLDFDLPEEVQSGENDIVLTIVRRENLRPHQTKASFSLTELMAEAQAKTIKRFADPCGDSLQRFCGSMQDVFNEDGVAIQRRLRDEWND
jgi:hypothetical protein